MVLRADPGGWRILLANFPFNIWVNSLNPKILLAGLARVSPAPGACGSEELHVLAGLVAMDIPNTLCME